MIRSVRSSIHDFLSNSALQECLLTAHCEILTSGGRCNLNVENHPVMTFRIKIPIDDPVWAHFAIWTKWQDNKITDLGRILIRVIFPDLLFYVRGIHQMVLHA
jgi:hypothetical protein